MALNSVHERSAFNPEEEFGTGKMATRMKVSDPVLIMNLTFHLVMVKMFINC